MQFFATDYIIANNEKLSNKNIREETLGVLMTLVASSCLTKSQCSTLAAQGLQSSHLKFALQKVGREGLHIILKGKLKCYFFNSVIDKVISFYIV